jgi:stearoyl-CoA desaturase (delta-9 desaturase)
VGRLIVRVELVESSASRSLAAPQATQPWRIQWIDATGLAVLHLLALLAFVPWLFSWTGVVLAVAGIHVFGGLGIGVCYHRLLTHRGFVCPKWLEHSLAVLGLCCLQDTPARWVAIHRRHHEHSDTQPDPHSPLVNFLWAHVGWMVFKNRDLTRLRVYERYAKDVLRDPFYARLERNFRWIHIVLISWAVFLFGGFFYVLGAQGTAIEALQFGLSVLVWGVFVRTVLVWHLTWSVNSVTHLWGYRNYDTGEDSRNNMLVGILTNGEAWHNNHHADPRSARHGHFWWELDLNWAVIRLLAALGLARKVAVPAPHLMTSRASGNVVASATFTDPAGP